MPLSENIEKILLRNESFLTPGGNRVPYRNELQATCSGEDQALLYSMARRVKSSWQWSQNLFQHQFLICFGKTPNTIPLNKLRLFHFFLAILFFKTLWGWNSGARHWSFLLVFTFPYGHCIESGCPTIHPTSFFWAEKTLEDGWIPWAPTSTWEMEKLLVLVTTIYVMYIWYLKYFDIYFCVC